MSIKKFIANKENIIKPTKLWEDTDSNGRKYLCTYPRINYKINIQPIGRQKIYQSEIIDLDHNNKLKKDIIEKSVISDDENSENNKNNKSNKNDKNNKDDNKIKDIFESENTCLPIKIEN